jgi:hypothetical protein
MDADVRIGGYAHQDLPRQAKPPGTLARFGASLFLDPKNRPLYEGRLWLPMFLQFPE